MLFREIQKNSPIFILDKKEFKVFQGKVISALPRVGTNKQTGQTQMFVDVEVDVDGKVTPYSIPENISVSYAGDLVLSVDKQGLVPIVESIRANAEQAINSMPYQQMILEQAPSVLADLNPQFRDRQETEKRFGKIESEMKDMKGDVNEIKADLKELLKKLS